MALKSTLQAVRAICSTDPSINPEQLRRALAAFNGVGITAHSDPLDKALTRRQVADILGVSTKSVTVYARRGVLRGVTLGDKRGHIRRYSEASVRALLAAREGGAK